MKPFFLILLLINGSLIMWHSYFVKDSSLPRSQQNSDAPELVLLAETGTTIETGLHGANETEGESESASGNFLSNPIPFAELARRCYSIGPFLEGADLANAQELLAERGISFSVRTLTEPELYGYNVILPPFSSREDAEKMVEILVDKGITDYFIMPDSNLRNAISLGLFREHRFATRHMAAPAFQRG